jgi:hypothetical protein
MKFLKFTTEVTTVEVPQPGSDLFEAQERFRQHSLCLSHSQRPQILRG